MTDLADIVPDFPVGQFDNLLQVLERHKVTTTELLTCQVADIGKRTQLPLLDIKRLADAVVAALHRDLGVSASNASRPESRPSLRSSLAQLVEASPALISTLDDSLDKALGGGIPTGYITEITGESGAAKTNFLLTLCLAVQLPAPHGLGRHALYISTEAGLSTVRLSQMLSHHPLLANLDKEDRPSLDNVHSAVTPDLESQEHIMEFQVPVMIERYNIGLVILDSVAANYRAEFERAAGKNRGSNMATRSNDLTRLGAHLRQLAKKHDLAVVVANQVTDRFLSPFAPASSRMGPPRSSYAGGGVTQESPLARRSKALPPGALDGLEPPSSMADHFRSSMPEPPGLYDGGGPPAPAVLALDHQQRWFTGWGDDPFADYGLKTPALGLIWCTQIACRITLLKQPVYEIQPHDDPDESGLPSLSKWRRWMKVVFAPHVQETGQGTEGAVEFAVTPGGLKGMVQEEPPHA
ncbi:DNA repair protein RAD57 [Plectosphaerella cucumerina]|uniref:DNA repair protein RAD57 n=1 Tax=Plectosphaerella cucumerina TaxID=40658 RepID=A0A8K0TK59_9PEZI|nr:DNA repair protein RAD57 [Plectosphaerella cucumerina]